VNVTVNGKARSIDGTPTLGEYLRQLGVNPLACAVERNGRVVKRDDFDGTPLADGDRLEVVRMMGGGAQTPGYNRALWHEQPQSLRPRSCRS
jgi:sulfur carrier protein